MSRSLALLTGMSDLAGGKVTGMQAVDSLYGPGAQRAQQQPMGQQELMGPPIGLMADSMNPGQQMNVMPQDQGLMKFLEDRYLNKTGFGSFRSGRQ